MAAETQFKLLEVIPSGMRITIDDPDPLRVKEIIRAIEVLGEVDCVVFEGCWVKEGGKYDIPELYGGWRVFLNKGTGFLPRIGTKFFNTSVGKIRASLDPDYKRDAWIDIFYNINEKL